MSNDILAKTEKLDQVVSNFATALNSYIEDMESELNSLVRALNALGEGWRSEAYDSFYDNMNARVKKIKAELEKAKELKVQLDEKAIMYSKMLELLKKSAQK